jgi:hypothetical protein
MADFDLDKTIEFLLSPRTVWVALSVGLALLTIALLILMRTRWGQARPLSKCVVLSVFAHLLLIGYAHMTQLFFDRVSSASDGTIEIEVIAEQPTAEAREQVHETQVELPPWEELGVDPPVPPPPVELPRRDPTADVPHDPQQVEPPPTVTTHLPEPSLPLDDVAATPRPIAVAPTSPQPRAPAVEAARLESEPVSRHSAPSREPTPDTAQLERLPTNISQTAAVPRRALPTPINNQQVVADRMQRLSTAAVLSESPDAVASREDNALRATNRANNNWQNVDPSRMPARNPPAGTAAAAVAATTGATAPPSSADAGSQATIRHPAAARPMVAIASRSPVAAKDLATIYRFRERDDCEQLGRTRGGTEDAEKAVQAALTFLASAQQDDGHWDASAFGGGAQRFVEGEDRKGAGTNADTGITALALLTFLAAGETHLKGEHRVHVQKGLEFLLRQQAHDGSLSGSASMFAKMYCHGMAALALGEAYAMTRDDRMRPYLTRAIAYTLAAQHPNTGGWRYHPWRHSPGDPGDMSQFGWQLMAIKSAAAAGLSIPENANALMRRFSASCVAGHYGGLASYRKGERVTPTMTAEALTCRFFLHEPLSQPVIDEAADFLLAELPGQGKPNLYYWYYATLALYQLQDERWETWNRALQRELLRSQRKSGTLAGSWDPNTVWGGCGGRVYSTAMAALCLEVYYRYLPLYETTDTLRQ